MLNETIETLAHTSKDGSLTLHMNVGVADTDVAVVVHVKDAPVSGDRDANGWPSGYFERIAGSMPDLRRAPQGRFEERLPLG